MSSLLVGFDVCNGTYPDHIKGAAPDDTEGKYKAFYQFEVWEARECAVKSTEKLVEMFRPTTQTELWDYTDESCV